MRIECLPVKSSKAVAGRRVQRLKKGRGVYHDQFSASYLGEICRETLRDHAALKDRLGKFPLEAPDHVGNVSHRDTYCKAFVSRRDTSASKGNGLFKRGSDCCRSAAMFTL